MKNAFLCPLRSSLFVVAALLAAATAVADEASPPEGSATSAEDAATPNEAAATDEVRALIEEADGLRRTRWQDGKALEAVALYRKAEKQGADPFEMAWKTASAYFWAGENLSDSKQLEETGKKCVAAAEKATKLQPERVEGHYYTAVCWGTYSHGVSIPTAILQGVEGKFKSAALKAEKIDPSFEDGAPLNALGRFYFEMPWPKRDLEKSKQYLARNVKQTPCNLRTRVYYAEAVLKSGKKVGGRAAEEVAREHLQFALDNEHCPGNPGDGELSKKMARKLLKELK